MTKLTPVLYVDAIEPCLPFWEGLGFMRAIEVPEGEVLGFVALAAGSVEVMLQTRANLAHDIPAFAGERFGPAVLYLEVDDLEAVDARLGAAPRVVPRRHTSYGADEVWVREPGGHIVGFAQHRG
jgi:hypothetical protein